MGQHKHRAGIGKPCHGPQSTATPANALFTNPRSFLSLLRHWWWEPTHAALWSRGDDDDCCPFRPERSASRRQLVLGHLLQRGTIRQFATKQASTELRVRDNRVIRPAGLAGTLTAKQSICWPLDPTGLLLFTTGPDSASCQRGPLAHPLAWTDFINAWRAPGQLHALASYTRDDESVDDAATRGPSPVHSPVPPG
jgi:hypothetical protein